MLDPVTLILAALSAGLAAGGQSAANEAVKDAYTGLKELIQRKFAHSAILPGNDLALLSKYEDKPGTWSEPLREVLVEVEADQDGSIATAAQQLLKLVERYQPEVAQHTYHVYGPVNTLVQGEKHQVTINNYDRRALSPMRPPEGRVGEGK